MVCVVQACLNASAPCPGLGVMPFTATGREAMRFLMATDHAYIWLAYLADDLDPAFLLLYDLAELNIVAENESLFRASWWYRVYTFYIDRGIRPPRSVQDLLALRGAQRRRRS